MAVARGMRPIRKREVRPTQRRGPEPCLEVDTYARLVHPTIPHGNLPILLLCDMAAARLSVSRRWRRTVVDCAGLPPAALRVSDAVKDGMLSLLNVAE